jgi:hypothetical protein
MKKFDLLTALTSGQTLESEFNTLDLRFIKIFWSKPQTLVKLRLNRIFDLS